MATFCECGADKVICQKCGADVCSKENKIKWIEGIGNVCETCQSNIWYENFQRHQPRPGNTAYDLMC